MDRQARQAQAQQQLAIECAELQAELLSFSSDPTRQQTTFAKQVAPCNTAVAPRARVVALLAQLAPDAACPWYST